MIIRRLGLSDLDAVHRLDRICFPPAVAFSRDAFEACLLDRACDCFGIDADGALAAFAVVFPQGAKALQIITIDVHPEHRRQGMGSALMEEIEKKARREGRRRVYLQVAVDNDPALALYQTFGFSVKSVLRDYYGPKKNAWLMDKDY